MTQRRRAKGFEPMGKLDPRQMGLPVGKARQLRLEQAWRKIAGEALSRRARAISLRRGVLEIEAEDRAWLAAVEPLLPRLAGRLVARHPDLGVTKYRLRLAANQC